ncbi:FtsB family cell division protein [Desulfitibacter alkalitolerans]|uniref:FtsB family cell division protein n=1 Tax=Desulfitibacter alkalitolerans TaxID=264641 RepID=UPI0004841395|nr:hypothetical protein [Desulfitibacter alkalitolerans]
MKGKGILVILMVLLAGIILIGCTSSNNSSDLEAQLQEKTALINQLTAENEALSAEVAELQLILTSQQQNSLLMTALTVVGLLENQDMEGLASYIHPVEGVRFSPYTYVDLQADLVFSAQQIETLLQSTQTYNWGSFDGTGDPIVFTFSDYYDRFIYDQDFANPHLIGNNVEIGTSSMINNIIQAYPNGMFVEFHFTGFDPQYMGMDWRSLRLVFEDVNGSWHLVGIVHDEWTT